MENTTTNTKMEKMIAIMMEKMTRKKMMKKMAIMSVERKINPMYINELKMS